MARIEHIQPEWLEQELRHFVIALGGGILLGAVAVVLVPEGLAGMNRSPLGVVFMLAGGVLFFAIEKLMGLRRREAPQLMGMLLDYIPEAVALGGMLATGAPVAPLLALLIGLQNLPEGFNAYRELVPLNGNSPSRTLRAMSMLVLLGPVAGVAGYWFLSDRPEVLGALMLLAAGGILYLIFQDIAPQSRLKRHWAPPLGAVIGFGVAMLGSQLTHPV
ncbi:ZIP family metal transporter [Marinobacterium aestuariivivens]|uniref:ZIP family metal transporter n=1 Tax=Marinobacterium aestuariivivens TaxID=1698799 RepID=A0ABW2A4F8_9GAMM